MDTAILLAIMKLYINRILYFIRYITFGMPSFLVKQIIRADNWTFIYCVCVFAKI